MKIETADIQNNEESFLESIVEEEKNKSEKENFELNELCHNKSDLENYFSILTYELFEIDDWGKVNKILSFLKRYFRYEFRKFW